MMIMLKETVIFMFSHNILQVIITTQCFCVLVAMNYNAQSLSHRSKILSLNAEQKVRTIHSQFLYATFSFLHQKEIQQMFYHSHSPVILVVRKDFLL